MLLALSTGGGITARADGEVLKTVAAAAGKTFHIKTERGYWYANSSGSNISASKGDFSTAYNGVDFNTTDEMSRFTIVKVKDANRYYLYNIDCSKWVAMNGNNLSLVEKPVFSDSIGFTATTGSRATTYPTCIYFGGQTANMYGISPVNRTPDVFKWNDKGDQGNNSSIVVSGTITDEDYNSLVSTVTSLYGNLTTAMTVSASPIAAASDFNGQTGKKYIIHNVSSTRNGYLHVDASGNITWKATLVPNTVADFANFVFTTETHGTDLVLKAKNGEYFPLPPTSYGTNFTTTSSQISGAGVVAVAAKSGYKPTTLNFTVGGRLMNVNPNGNVTTWNDVNDGNGVWEFTPVENNDFVTSTVSKSITNQDGTTATVQADPAKYRNGQTIYLEADNFILPGTGTVNGETTTINVKEKLPFDLSTDDNWHWYCLDLRDDQTGRKWLALDNGSKSSVSISTTFTDSDNSLWAFQGSQTSGIKVFNKALGKDYTLKGTDNSATMGTGDTNNRFIILKNSDGFVLKTSRSNNNCLHDLNNSFSYWNSNSAPTDPGSTFRVFLAKGFYTLKNYMNAAQSDESYGYLGLSSDPSTNNIIMGNDATVSLNDVVYIAPTSAPGSETVDPRYVSMQLQGQDIQGVSESAQVTIGTTNNAKFLLKRPYVGYFAFGSAVSSATPDNRSYLHTANSLGHKVVGYSTDAPATSWQVSPAGAIKMTATEVAGKYYATFYAPFAVKLTGATAYTLTLNADKTSATLNKVELKNGNILPKESAVLIIAEGASYTVEPVIDNATSVSSILKGVSLAESWGSHGDDLILGLGQVNNKIGFYKWGTNNKLKNNRCYLPASVLNGTESSAKGVVINFGTPTGINAATLQPGKADGKIYNLQGQEVSRGYKGIVIKNGSKVIQ